MPLDEEAMFIIKCRYINERRRVDVMCYVAGHELYLQSVEQQGLYPVTSRMRPLAELDAEEFCIVDEV